MGKVFFRGGNADPSVPVVITPGMSWTITESGQFKIPKSGIYQVELHGGGGGAAARRSSSINVKRAGGGGSGETYTVEYTKGQVIDATIGAGGTGASGTSGTQTATAGGQTVFGDLSVDGGGGGKCTSSAATAGTASGSLASAGSTSTATSTGTIAGGEGNTSNTAQTYGDGGSASYASSAVSVTDGQPGAVIITLLEVS